MNWKDVAKAIAGVAPILASAIPGGTVVTSFATKAIAAALGVDEKPDAVIEAIKADPTAATKLIEIQTKHAEVLMELGIKEQQVFLADRQSARAREMTVQDKMPMILGITVVAVTLLLEGIILLNGSPSGVDGVVIGRVLGTLDSALIMVLSYYYGSSSGSKAKTDILASNGHKV